MSETKPDSGADAPKLTKFEKQLKKGRIRLFLDANLNPGLSGTFKYHIHPEVRVPWQILRLWKKRGYKPLKSKIAHVRFEDSDKKYTFPAYFVNPRKVEV